MKKMFKFIKIISKNNTKNILYLLKLRDAKIDN